MQLVFMGTPDFAVATLKALVAAGHEIVAVYSQPPGPPGRGQSVRPSPVHEFAAAQGIEVRTPLSLKSAEEQKSFADLKADAAVVVAYGLASCRKPILDAPRSWLLQCACLAAAALAGCCAHSARHHGGRSGIRRHHHAHGGGARYGADVQDGPCCHHAGNNGGLLHDQLAELGAP